MRFTEKKKPKFGEILVDSGLISEDDLRKALEQQKNSGARLGDTLIEMGFVSPEEIISALSNQLEIPHVWLRKGLIDPKIINIIPQNKAEKYRVIPLFKVKNTLTIATSDPQSIFALDDLARLTGCEVQPVLCRSSEIESFIKEYYDEELEFDSFLSTLEESDVRVVETGEEKTAEELGEIAEGSPIINLVNLIILNGIRDGASDIHIEPDLKKLRVRYRIDGVLYEVTTYNLDLHSAIISRLKVMGNLDIAERRLPQDGRIRVTVEGIEIDLRFSSMPTILGEKVVLRILDRRQAILDLEQLGFGSTDLKVFKSLLLRPNGLILVVGPTGSGKTTTLYSAINLIRSMEKNLITIEDPVEYQLEIINQVQVDHKTGLTFAKILRSVLRQDPDIVLVGEIRDLETAEVAIQASLTGHMVLSTLHTNDSVGAVARLLDMGLEPYLISSSLTCVLAQRLVRVVCDDCKTLYFPAEPTKKTLGRAEDRSLRLAKGRGCEACYDSGFKGRIGIYELLQLDDELKEMILRNPSSEEIREHARKKGQLFLADDGYAKVIDGTTSIEEVTRVIHAAQDFGGM